MAAMTRSLRYGAWSTVVRTGDWVDATVRASARQLGSTSGTAGCRPTNCRPTDRGQVGLPMCSCAVCTGLPPDAPGNCNTSLVLLVASMSMWASSRRGASAADVNRTAQLRVQLAGGLMKARRQLPILLTDGSPAAVIGRVVISLRSRLPPETSSTSCPRRRASGAAASRLIRGLWREV